MKNRLVGMMLVACPVATYAQEASIFSARAVFDGSSAPLSVLPMQPSETVQAESLPALRPITPERGAGMAPSPAGHAATLAPALGPVRLAANGISAPGMAGLAGDSAPGYGAAGDMQYVQLVDSRLAVYSKADAALLAGPLRGAALYDAAHPCATGGSTSVHFDQFAKRWILSHLARSENASASAGYYHCLAVSAGADATGSYHRYHVALTSHDGKLLQGDDPRFAIWSDAYYLTLALFDAGSGAYRGPRACGIDRAAVLAGRDATVRCRDLGAAYGALSPANMEGYASTVDGDGANLLLALDHGADGRGQNMFAWRYSFSRDTFSEAQAIPVAPFQLGCADALGGACIGQPAPGSPLAAASDRLMPRAAYRNRDGIASLVVNHSVQVEGRVAIRWYELRDAGEGLHLYQQGTHAPDHNSRWMGSMAIDKEGNIALAYQVAGPDTPPGIRVTGRQRSDPHGRMQGEAWLFDGSGVQSGPAEPPRLHGALTLDPIDSCTFWAMQRYAAVTGLSAWRTRIVSFRFENCS